MLVAIDDTDSATGGCTTHLVFHVLLALPELALRSMPRLVRLNPNAPHKTRGNGAVVLELTVPEGPQTRVGELRGQEILAFPDGPTMPSEAWVLERVKEVVAAQSQPDASPGVTVMDSAPAWLYEAGVKEELPVALVDNMLADSLHWGDRGLIGCLAATAWPGPATSYEFIAYREPSRWGTPREVDDAPLKAIEGFTFHTYDKENQVLCCVPNTPCPVLLGLRGLDAQVTMNMAIAATQDAAKEPVDGWLLFATNQASGDHVTPVEHLLECPTWGTVSVWCRVLDNPVTMSGGHVHAPAEDAFGNATTLVAFEPTKNFRNIVRELRAGDEVTAVGACTDAIRLEKLEVRRLASKTKKLANPLCPECDKSMTSRGDGAGYKCKKCGVKAPPSAAIQQEEERTLAKGWYEVPVIARRHLHRPN